MKGKMPPQLAKALATKKAAKAPAPKPAMKKGGTMKKGMC